MFTGIIEEIGTVKGIQRDEKSCILSIQAKSIMDDVRVGDSIATNGVCLTATTVSPNGFTADVMAETLRRSSLGDLKPGSHVNLERAMQMNGRFGGHIVSGHIDGTGKIAAMDKEDNAVWVKIACDDNLLKYIIEKGSIAMDGISLTVAKVTACDFSVSIIPHTKDETTLLSKKIGDRVNLENDMVGKYIEHFMHFGDAPAKKEKKSGLSMDTLMENGFM